MSSAERDGARLTRWETVGAWTHLWTPPRDAIVPPVPWRKLGIGTVLGAIAATVALALIIPPIEAGKRAGAAREIAKQAAIVAAETARLRADQQLHRASLGVAGTALVRALEREIDRDARARVRAGTMEGPVLATTCEAGGKALAIRAGTRVYKCYVQTSLDTPGQAGVHFSTGYPFVATIDFRNRSVAWCKTNPQPGEKTGGHGIAHVKLSPACAGTLSELL